MRTNTIYNPLLIDNTAVCGAFGMMIKSREFVAFDEYRMGFNGKENDREISGDGNNLDYGFRIYDSRLGKFLSIDPLTKDYPEQTPYQYTENSPIAFIDIDGLEKLGASQKFISTFWKPIFSVVFKDDMLKQSLYTNISRDGLKDKVVVLFATFKNDNTNYGGFTTDLLGQAKFMKGYENGDYEINNKNKALYAKMGEIFTDLKLTPDDIINYSKSNKDIKVLVIAMNETVAKKFTGNELRKKAAKIFANEVNAHLLKFIRGLNTDAYDNHIEYFKLDVENYDDVRKIQDFDFQGAKSLPESEFKKGSPAKMDAELIDKVVDKDQKNTEKK